MTRDELFAYHQSMSFLALELMKKKNRDYGADTDPFRNFRGYGAFGILVRLSDKLSRTQTFLEKGTLAVEEERIEDTLRDALNYVVLLSAYLEDEKEKKEGPRCANCSCPSPS